MEIGLGVLKDIVGAVGCHCDVCALNTSVESEIGITGMHKLKPI